MPSITTSMTNAQRRAVLVARFEERLRELWPDETPGGRVPFSDFNDLELKATVLGDNVTREPDRGEDESGRSLGEALAGSAAPAPGPATKLTRARGSGSRPP